MSTFLAIIPAFIGIETLQWIIVAIICILSIVLFFKVWGMCNNVKEIKGLLKDIKANTSKN